VPVTAKSESPIKDRYKLSEVQYKRLNQTAEFEGLGCLYIRGLTSTLGRGKATLERKGLSREGKSLTKRKRA